MSRPEVTPLPDGTAGVSWRTDENADATVLIGSRPDALTPFRSDDLEVAHTVVATGLRPGSTYHYRITSVDAAGNAAVWPPAAEPPATFVSAAVGVADRTGPQFRTNRGASGVYLQQDDLGEVTLAPTAGAEFSTPALGSDWENAAETADGSIGFRRGRLLLNGRNAGTRATFGPGRSLSFQATFDGSGRQWAGLAAGTANDPWAMFGMSDGVLYAALNTSGLQKVALPGNLVGTSHAYRIDWTSTGFTFFVDGRQVASMTAAVSKMRPRARDVTADRTPLVIDWVRLSGYASSGSQVSRVLDAQQMVTWDRLRYRADVPAGSSLRISVRMGSTPTPDATWSAWTPVDQGGRVAGSSRYLQYRVEMGTTAAGRTPVLRDIGVTHNGVPLNPPTESSN
jgi:hypothetical protein